MFVPELWIESSLASGFELKGVDCSFEVYENNDFSFVYSGNIGNMFD